MPAAGDASLAAELARSDYDRYLAALFAPQALRTPLIALYAFNHELARASEVASQPMIGLMRLTWWRETVEGIYGGQVRNHALTQQLAQAIGKHDLPRHLFETMLDAREADIEETPFADIASLETYAGSTAGTLMRLAARILGAGESLDKPAHDAGIAYGLTGLLRSLSFRARRRNLVLPLDALATSGLSPEAVFAGAAGMKLAPVLGAVAERANRHYAEVHVLRLPRRFLPAILPATLVPSRIRAITAPGYDAIAPQAVEPIHRRQWAMLAAMMQGRV